MDNKYKEGNLGLIKTPKPDERMVTSLNPVYIVFDNMETEKTIQTIYSYVNSNGTIYGDYCRICFYQKIYVRHK